MLENYTTNLISHELVNMFTLHQLSLPAITQSTKYREVDISVRTSSELVSCTHFYSIRLSFKFLYFNIFFLAVCCSFYSRFRNKIHLVSDVSIPGLKMFVISYTFCKYRRKVVIF